MKRNLLVIGILSFYLLSSLGLVLNVHFCGGKVAQVSLVVTDEENCCAGDSNGCHPLKREHQNCCFDQHIVLYSGQPTYLSGIDLLVLQQGETTICANHFPAQPAEQSQPLEPGPAPPGKYLRILYQALIYYG